MLKQYITHEEDGDYFLSIPVNKQYNIGGHTITVESITMYCGIEDDAYSDLAVNWDSITLENTGGGDMGSLLMRGWNDQVGEVMGGFYWNHEFDGELSALLAAAGFTADASVVSGSEWGMQDEGRASYDASYELIEEIKKACMEDA